MAAELQLTFPIVSPGPISAEKALQATTRLWFVVTVLGQLLFAFTVASYYALTAARGDMAAWGRSTTRGYIAGDTVGNSALAMHLLAAVVIILAGAVQLIPQVRARFPRTHRWIGRVYMLTAVVLSGAGLYLLWVRGSIGDLSQRMGATLNAVLIWLCAAMALRYAVARDFRTHRRWALRLFLVVSASWYFRVGLFLSFLVFKGPIGFDPTTFRGPFLTFMAFGQYLVPLAVLELYFLAQARPGAGRRVSMAAGLVFVTLATAAGVIAVAAAVWVPTIKTAFDSRKSIATTLSATIAANGIDAATKQYQTLKTTQAAVYNFDENQLNRLGYQLLSAKKHKEAISIFQLNVDAYPKSSNTWDSLAEAYLNAGDRAQAIVHYRKAVQLNPNNRNAAAALHKLGS